ncbi:MAG: bifunctional glutamate N-acetyltransferase/amino-acid acetyltransferase ArgJ [Candidatus Methylacidiphilales bacterium]
MFKWIEQGGVTSPEGFAAAGVSCGVKLKKKKDLCLIVSEVEARVGVTFTTNRIKAAPVKLSMQHARQGVVKAIVANSGNANACTGVRGIRDARAMADKVAGLVGCRRRKVLVCSTGKIGIPLPIENVLTGIETAFKRLSHLGGDAAAKAIRTTDTTTKQGAVEIKVGGKTVRIGGMAKGAGMIHPNMATMLAFLTSDLAIEKELLQRMTGEIVQESFNMISVDGDTSTNDTVFVLANGVAGNEEIHAEHPDYPQVREAFKAVMSMLARMIVEDGECITHVVHLKVQGAASDTDARKIVDALAHSPLVKSSWAGADPNWGRIMDVIGYSGARVREELVDIYYDGLCAVKGGVAANVPAHRIKRVVEKKNFSITMDLHLLEGKAELLVNDLTPGYVKFNMGD